MSWFSRIFGGQRGKARAAEGAGQWREAAALWAELGDHDAAAKALLHLAEQLDSLTARLRARRDALRWISEDQTEWRDEVEIAMATDVVGDAEIRGVASVDEKRRLQEAARTLEALGEPGQAARAFALLGQRDAQARALEKAGDIDALESLLDRLLVEEADDRNLSRLLSDHEAAIRYGDRRAADQAIQEAIRLAPDDRSVAEMAARFETRRIRGPRVFFQLAEQRIGFVGEWPAVLGREAWVRVRGASVSRAHAEMSIQGDRVLVRDLDSRNGTLVGRMPIRGSIELSEGGEVGLGDDVQVHVKIEGAALRIEVRAGVDRHVCYRVGDGPLRHEGLAASVRFEDGWPVLVPDPETDLWIGEQACSLPIDLLDGDKIRLGEHTFEVCA